MRSSFARQFISALRRQESLPKFLELSQIGPIHLASAYDTIRSEIITESIFSGMDIDPEIAILKSLVEMVERTAFAEGKRNGLPSCSTDRSDGFAAFPIGSGINAQKTARENALSEAIERYVWSQWWDDPSIGHHLSPVDLNGTGSSEEIVLGSLSSLISIREAYRVIPNLENSDGKTVILYFAFLQGYGVVSGGAAGSSDEKGKISFRACTELCRHALAAVKMKRENLLPKSFYEKRLHFFAHNSSGKNLATRRIQERGSKTLSLPGLKIDHLVPHRLDALVSVHRCLFENQPAFIGGHLERLCL